MENVHSKPIVQNEPLSVRGASGPQEEVADTKDLNVDKEIPVTLYKGRMGKPFASEVFKEISVYDRETSNKLDLIEEHVLESMKEQGIKDSKSNYTKYLNKMMHELGINPEARAEIKVGKLHSVITMQRMGMLKPENLSKLLTHFNGNGY